MIAHTDRFKPKPITPEPTSEYAAIADDIMRHMVEWLNIPASVIEPEHCNYASAKVNSDAWRWCR